ncbi:hypothetical protein B0H13DRAFT_2299292 [Mycena leptocephala]|nr:hypothetical protein B0H13DRAFT_2299292 [Mycena leptocephala]
MDSLQLATLPYLAQNQKGALEKGNLQTVAELLLISPQDLGRRCRIPPLEAKSIFDIVCQNNAPQIRSLADVAEDPEQVWSTGDSYLDAALGGGLRTGMVWEILGLLSKEMIKAGGVSYSSTNRPCVKDQQLAMIP